jgi:hypothetical protein
MSEIVRKGGSTLTLPHWGSQVYALESACVRFRRQRMDRGKGKGIATKCQNQRSVAETTRESARRIRGKSRARAHE